MELLPEESARDLVEATAALLDDVRDRYGYEDSYISALLEEIKTASWYIT